MGNSLLPNNPTLDDIKKLIKKINSKIKIINASVNQEILDINSPIATIIQSESTDPGEYTTTDIDTSNFYTKNEVNTLLENKVNVTSIKDMAYINDAPLDNKGYARKNGEWSEVTNSGTSEWGNISGTLSNQTDLSTALNAKANFTDLGDLASEDDAPSDGAEYVRKNGSWAISSGGSSGTTAWGDIIGTLSNQTDLNTALSEKANSSSVYTKTETDNLLLTKINTTDLDVTTMNVVWNDNISKRNAGSSRFSGQSFVFNWNFLTSDSINANSVIATITNLPSDFIWVYGIILDGNNFVGRCHTTSNTIIVDVALTASKNYTLIISGFLV